MTASPSAPRRAYLVGTAYSGSTVFGQALASGEGVRYLGEINRLVRWPPTAWAGEPEPTCHYCTFRDQTCPVWTPERISEARSRDIGELMDYFQSDLGPDLMIDGSKDPFWLRTVMDRGGIDPTRTVVFVTVRSPFAFVASHLARTPDPAWLPANTWRDVYYDTLRILARFRLPFLVVRYEDFALDPESVLKPASSLLGTRFDPRMLHFQTLPTHDIGGNYSAHAVVGDTSELDVKSIEEKIPEYWRPGTEASAREYWGKPFGGWVDAKWQRRLTADDVELITQTPGLMNLANLLGYELSRDIAAWEQSQTDPGTAVSA